MRFAVLLVVLLTSALAGCQTVAETGRSTLNFYSPEEENQLGAESYAEVLKDAPVSGDRKTSDMLQRVGSRIAAISEHPDWEWEFTLIDSDQVNAFALPGGKVAVYTGILPYTRDEGGLAAVIGHEIAHAIARHGGQRLTQYTLVSGGQSVISAALGGQSDAVQQIAGQGFGVISQFGVLMPYGRQQESEADHIGMLYMARAGYDPRAAIGLWERMPSSDSMEWLSTHPKNQTRIEQLKELLPKAQDEYQRSPYRNQ